MTYTQPDLFAQPNARGPLSERLDTLMRILQRHGGWMPGKDLAACMGYNDTRPLRDIANSKEAAGRVISNTAKGYCLMQNAKHSEISHCWAQRKARLKKEEEQHMRELRAYHKLKVRIDEEAG